MAVVGLTGGIGSGKSTVSELLAERGATIVDADAVARELQEPGGPVLERMVEHFGAAILDADGRLDRAKVAEIVFSDPEQLEALNSLSHPLIAETVNKRIAEAVAPGRLVVLDNPLLIEMMGDPDDPVFDLDAVVVVDTPEDLAVARLVADRGFDEADAWARVSNQMDRDQRRSHADRVVDNSGDLASLAEQVDGVVAWARGLAAADAAWDIETLVDGAGESGVKALLDEADALSDRMAEARGTIAGMDASGLADYMRSAEELADLVGRAGSYASLRFSVNTADPAAGALMQRVEERSTAISTKLVFFELEWAALDDDSAEALLSSPELEWCEHHLRSIRRYRDHLLSEPEEKILAEKSVTGRSAWTRLFDELTSAIDVQLPTADGGKRPAPLEEALSMLGSPDRQQRRSAAEAVTAGLAPGLRTRAFVLNTLLADKSIDDRLRRYPSWIASRNLANEASDESVESLITAVQARYEIARRWYRLKSRILGYELSDYDRMASVADVEAEVGWAQAREIVLDAYDSFSPEISSVVRKFFDEEWIDAPVRPGKRPGAFCAYTVPSHHPYLLLNWTSRQRDVLTLAHELGHGVHAFLARDQGPFQQMTPLTLAETASVFGETVTFDRLLETTDDPAERLSLLASSIEGGIATVFRQTAMNRFEHAVHTERREVGELSVDRFGELWARTQADLLGDAVEITEGYRSWWSYIPHFIGTPGYVYAYSYGQLLALSVYREYTRQGGDFVDRYIRMLSAGSSMPPEDLTRLVGCDLEDPGFWDGGLDIVEQQVDAAEQAAVEAGRIS